MVTAHITKKEAKLALRPIAEKIFLKHGYLILNQHGQLKQ